MRAGDRPTLASAAVATVDETSVAADTVDNSNGAGVCTHGNVKQIVSTERQNAYLMRGQTHLCRFHDIVDRVKGRMCSV